MKGGWLGSSTASPQMFFHGNLFISGGNKPDMITLEKRIGQHRRVTGDIVALMAGLLMPFGFAPFGWYALTVVALAFLFPVLISVSPARAFWRGWIFGLAMFGLGVFWIHESFGFAAVALPLAILSTGALIAFLAIYPALFGVFVAALSRKSMVRRSSPSPTISPSWKSLPAGGLLLALPAGWILQEWVRGWFLGGFPWLEIGYAHMDSPLVGLAPLLGVYGVGWAAAVSAGIVLLAFRAGMRDGKSTVTTRVAGVSVLLVLVGGIWGGSAWLDGITWVKPIGAPIRVALIQGNVPQEEKWLPSRRGSTLYRYLSLTRQAKQNDLVIWPETALPGYYHEFRGFIAGLRQEFHAHGMNILLGVPVLDKESQRYFNSVVAITDAGEAFYHKRHLVPFGEYLPMAGVLRGILDFLMIPMSDFSTGPLLQAPLDMAGQTIGVSVCYEASFGRDIIASLPQATLLINVSNDAWFGDSSGPHQNLQMARMRARESGRYLLRGTNTGISAIIDPRGRIMSRAPQFREFALTGAVIGMSGATPYVRYGNRIVVSATLIVLVIGMLISRVVGNRVQVVYEGNDRV
uniref:Apolipoprotein N-acyltransferase n=1 Tax=Candidatus Kentrum sp. FW TaxID=2126338 RepID=A0A450RZR2_9GAMM|nr:MAG: apolipoprotein N-acyltransferase [Candidatus Kentron sp. FW]